jgi:hypothetical protein
LNDIKSRLERDIEVVKNQLSGGQQVHGPYGQFMQSDVGHNYGYPQQSGLHFMSHPQGNQHLQGYSMKSQLVG